MYDRACCERAGRAVAAGFSAAKSDAAAAPRWR
jgi:hypothetical protein